jgi:hypothetical protein
MRMRVLLGTAAVAVVIFYLLRMAGGSPGPDRPVRERRPAAMFHPAGEPSLVPAPQMRNVFQYADGGAPAARAEKAAPTPPSTLIPLVPSPVPSPLVRLVGLLRRGGRVRAALALAGETAVLAPGESAAGYTLVSIDEDEGVRLRAPDGSTVVLMPSSSE